MAMNKPHPVWKQLESLAAVWHTLRVEAAKEKLIELAKESRRDSQKYGALLVHCRMLEKENEMMKNIIAVIPAEREIHITVTKEQAGNLLDMARKML